MAALNHLREFILHVVAQVIKAVLVVGAVSDIAGVSSATLVIIQAVDDDTHAHAEKVINLSHPLRVAPGKVIIDGHNMDTTARQSIQINRERRDKRFAFSRFHFCNAALMQHHAADQLNIEMALTQRTPCSFPHGRKGWHKQIIQCFTRSDLGFEHFGTGQQLRVAQCLYFRFKRVDGFDLGSIAFDPAVVGRTEYFLGNGAEHGWRNLWSSARMQAQGHHHGVVVENVSFVDIGRLVRGCQ